MTIILASNINPCTIAFECYFLRINSKVHMQLILYFPHEITRHLIPPLDFYLPDKYAPLVSYLIARADTLKSI